MSNVNFISNLSVYNQNVWNNKFKQFESLKNLGSFDEWLYYSFGIPSNSELNKNDNNELTYWEEIKLIPNFWEMLDEILNQSKEFIREKLNKNENFIMDKKFIEYSNDYIQINSIIRYYINQELTQKYRTLLFEKINIIAIILEKINRGDETLDNDESKEFYNINLYELSSLYDDIHEKFYNEFFY